MPEGDTIFRAARALNKALAGKAVTGFETMLAPLARVNDDTPIVGRTVERVEARAKWLLIYFSGDLVLVTHMRMSGSWHLYRIGEKWMAPRNQMRVVIRVGPQGDPAHAQTTALEGGTQDSPGLEAVLFNAQVAEFHTAQSLQRSRSQSAQMQQLGIDVLGGSYSVEAGARALRDYGRRQPEAEIGHVLLNQRVIAGLGNVYKSEVAFAAGVHPFRAMRTIIAGELERIAEAAQRYMTANAGEDSSGDIVTYAGGRRTTRALDLRSRLWVYGRRGQECRRCGSVIEMRRQGPGARVTFWCPSCQPWRA